MKKLWVSIDISYAVGFIYFTFFGHWLWWFQFRLVSYISHSSDIEHSSDIDYDGFSLEIVEFHIGWDRAWKGVYKWETSLTLQVGFVRVVLQVGFVRVIRPNIKACWNLGPNSSLQNRHVRWGVPSLYKLFSRVISIW
jgi:hypothetical protein